MTLMNEVVIALSEHQIATFDSYEKKLNVMLEAVNDFRNMAQEIRARVEQWPTS